MRRLGASLVFCALLILPAAANPVVVTDYPWATAYYSPGLITGTGTPLRIASEDLYISPDRVRIRYVLANDTGAVRTASLVFPLPEIDVGKHWFDPDGSGKRQRSQFGRHTGDPLNFIGFRVTVNGKPVPVKGYQFAYAWRSKSPSGQHVQVDATEEIKAAGLPVILFGKSDIIDRLPEVTRRKLYDSHLLSTHDEQGWEPGRYPKTYYPAWHVLTQFSWKQRVPAKGTVTLDVAYQPVSGGSLGPVRGDQLGWETGNACYRDWAFPDWMPRGLKHRKAVRYRTTGYILTTARYWNGPIGRFHLTVDKLNPKAVLSFCWDGPLKKTGPTTYEFTAERFAPKQNIRITVFE